MSETEQKAQKKSSKNSIFISSSAFSSTNEKSRIHKTVHTQTFHSQPKLENKRLKYCRATTNSSFFNHLYSTKAVEADELLDQSFAKFLDNVQQHKGFRGTKTHSWNQLIYLTPQKRHKNSTQQLKEIKKQLYQIIKPEKSAKYQKQEKTPVRTTLVQFLTELELFESRKNSCQTLSTQKQQHNPIKINKLSKEIGVQEQDEQLQTTIPGLQIRRKLTNLFRKLSVNDIIIKFQYFNLQASYFEILAMKLRKQAMIFCGSSGSSNYDQNDHLGPNRAQVQSYLSLNDKHNQHQPSSFINFLKSQKNPLFQKSTQIFTEIKLASICSSESPKYLSTNQTEKRQSKTDQIHALELSQSYDFIFDDLETIMSSRIITEDGSTVSEELSEIYQVESMSDVISVQNLQ